MAAWLAELEVDSVNRAENVSKTAGLSVAVAVSAQIQVCIYKYIYVYTFSEVVFVFVALTAPCIRHENRNSIWGFCYL